MPEVLEVDDTLYFAPIYYLGKYVSEKGTFVSNLFIYYSVPKESQDAIRQGKILTENDIKYLHKITNVSKQTWRNLDESWQKGKIKYERLHNSYLNKK